MTRFLLDTNLLLGFLRGAPWAIRIRAELNLPEALVFTSTICRGELLALAEKNGWGRKRRTLLEKIMNEVPTLDIGRPTISGSPQRLTQAGLLFCQQTGTSSIWVTSGSNSFT